MDPLVQLLIMAIVFGLVMMFFVSLVINLVHGLRHGGFGQFKSTIRKITLLMVFQNFCVIAVVLVVSQLLMQFFWPLRFSWLFGFVEPLEIVSMDRPPMIFANIFMLPIFIPFVGIAFLILLLLNMPRLAQREEEIFREGTKNWLHGIWKSLTFGLVHCLVGVPLGVGFALSIGGLWFTYQYFKGGVPLSTLHHATYNLIIAFVFLTFLIGFHIAIIALFLM